MSVFLKKISTQWLFPLAAGLFLSTSAVADVQLARTGGINCVGYIGEDLRIGVSFTTGPVDYLLQSVTTGLFVRKDAPSAAAGYAIHEDDAGFPGALIEDMGLTSLIPAEYIGDFTLNSTGIRLTARTTYWIVYKSTGYMDLVGASPSTTTSTSGWTLGVQVRWSTGYQANPTCGYHLSIDAQSLQIFYDGFE